MKKQNIPRKITALWQSMEQKVRTSKEWTQAHVEELHHKQESYGETEIEAPREEKEKRITLVTAIRIIMAELGETEYWRTLWQMLWRPGYVMSDFINGKGRRYLKPFQLLMGTTILLAIALTIVPAKVDKGESLVTRFESGISEKALTEEAKEKAKPIWTCIEYAEKYRLWKEEHTTYNLCQDGLGRTCDACII